MTGIFSFAQGRLYPLEGGNAGMADTLNGKWGGDPERSSRGENVSCLSRKRGQPDASERESSL